MASKKKILIIDDHPMFREGLKSIIARNPELEVVGETGEGKDVLELAKNLKPDMVVLDISLPDVSGIDLTRELKGILPEIQTLMVSMHTKIDYITSAFQAGAKGYVVKDAPSEKILQALDLVSRGEYFLDSSIAPQVVERLAEGSGGAAKVADAAYASLTSREQEILRLIAEGQSVKKISQQLCISTKTVENHRTNIMSKLGLHSTMELVRYAAKLGLIDLDHWKS
ncbi:MAG: response regulator transcription factor [Syntrophales bacterium]|nr:response regulator transcription factor [Syntrophales bacterium]MDD5640556.1 response regulator transcription factor [Syntrophales bacterium]